MEKERESKKIINIDLDDDESENNTNADTEMDASADIDADADGDADAEAYDDVDTNHSNAESSNLHSESGTSNASNKKNKKITRALKNILTSNNTKFMSNFDPELSNREKRKLNRKLNAEGKRSGSLYDENGALNVVEKDMCDCLNENCPGCHFPCPKCRSCKCGIECRINRKWVYEAIENEADLVITKNSSVSTN